jgi:conjugative transfer signal peptidase TraF
MGATTETNNKRKWLIFGFVAPIVVLSCSALYWHIQVKPILMNVSASEPEGIYRLTNDAPMKGSLITFMVPAAVHPFVEAHLTYLEKTPILKEIIASTGDTVCARDQALWINGFSVGNIHRHTPAGVPLPQWRECRALRAGEYFVFSDKIPNSFDSRYYGPISRPDILGVYKPLWLPL